MDTILAGAGGALYTDAAIFRPDGVGIGAIQRKSDRLAQAGQSDNSDPNVVDADNKVVDDDNK